MRAYPKARHDAGTEGMVAQFQRTHLHDLQLHCINIDHSTHERVGDLRLLVQQGSCFSRCCSLITNACNQSHNTSLNHLQTFSVSKSSSSCSSAAAGVDILESQLRTESKRKGWVCHGSYVTSLCCAWRSLHWRHKKVQTQGQQKCQDSEPVRVKPE